MKNHLRHTIALSCVIVFSLTAYSMSDREKDYQNYHNKNEEIKEERRDAIKNATDIHALVRAIEDYRSRHKSQKKLPKHKNDEITHKLKEIIRKKHKTLKKEDVLKLYKGDYWKTKVEAAYKEIENETASKSENVKKEGEKSDSVPTKKRH